MVGGFLVTSPTAPVMGCFLSSRLQSRSVILDLRSEWYEIEDKMILWSSSHPLLASRSACSLISISLCPGGPPVTHWPPDPLHIWWMVIRLNTIPSLKQ